MLPKKFRLPPKIFDSVYRNGSKVRGRYGMFVCANNDVGNPRFGFTVSKKIGGAVTRNRMTRLLRASVMDVVKEKNLAELSMDFQYIAFKFCDKKSKLEEEISKQFDEILDNEK